MFSADLLLPPPPKKGLRKDLVVGRITYPPKMSMSSSLEPVNVLVYVMWQGEINAANGVQVANQLILSCTEQPGLPG